MTPSIQIEHKIDKSREGTYYTIDFDVPDGVFSLTVSYSYAKRSQGFFGDNKKASVVDLGLINADGSFVGWSGSARDTVTVAPYGGTPGYFRQSIKGGTWKIIVGAYKIYGGCTDVKYNITFNRKESRFYFGDLHMHSVASDGQFSAYELALKAKKQGLDFIAAADHNNYSENFSLPGVDGITLIPAVEWTHYKGHMNFFGVKAPFENTFIANSESEMQALISDVKSRGAIISVNHPKCTVCPYLWQDDEAFDMVEIWNGVMRKTNAAAIEWWTEMLAAGRKIPAVGGSDYHGVRTPAFLGRPVTAVYSDSGDAEPLLRNISAGHSFITRSVRGPRLLIKCAGAMMGDTVRAGGGSVRIEITAERLGGAELRLVTGAGEMPVSAPGADIPAKSAFAYLKAVGKSGRIKAITNPIYFEGNKS